MQNSPLLREGIPFLEPSLEIGLQLHETEASVSTSKKLLDQDVLRTAISLGINPESARNFLSNTSYSLESSSKVRDRINNQPKILSLLNRLAHDTPLGFVYFGRESRQTFCNLDIEQIARLVLSRNGIPGFWISSGLPKEARETAITEVLNHVWRHEREHLLQMMQPDKEKQIKDSFSRYRYIRSISLISVITGSTIAVTSIALRSDNIPLVLGSGGLAVIGSLLQAKSEYHLRHSATHEAEAYRTGKEREASLTSPFTVTFK